MTIKALWQNARFVRMTDAGRSESAPHAERRLPANTGSK
jgi:hypothetical protein